MLVRLSWLLTIVEHHMRKRSPGRSAFISMLERVPGTNVHRTAPRLILQTVAEASYDLHGANLTRGKTSVGVEEHCTAKHQARSNHSLESHGLHRSFNVKRVGRRWCIGFLINAAEVPFSLVYYPLGYLPMTWPVTQE